MNVMRKVWSLINQVVIGKQKDDYYFQKDTLFDILSLVNQLYKLRSTNPKNPKCGKIYFSENQVSDLISLGCKHVPWTFKASKKTIGKKYMTNDNILDKEPAHKTVDELFRKARKNTAVTSNL